MEQSVSLSTGWFNIVEAKALLPQLLSLWTTLRLCYDVFDVIDDAAELVDDEEDQLDDATKSHPHTYDGVQAFVASNQARGTHKCSSMWTLSMRQVGGVQ